MAAGERAAVTVSNGSGLARSRLPRRSQRRLGWTHRRAATLPRELSDPGAGGSSDRNERLVAVSDVVAALRRSGPVLLLEANGRRTKVVQRGHRRRDRPDRGRRQRHPLPAALAAGHRHRAGRRALIHAIPRPAAVTRHRAYVAPRAQVERVRPRAWPVPRTGPGSCQLVPNPRITTGIRGCPHAHGGPQGWPIRRRFATSEYLPENRGVAGSIPALAIFIAKRFLEPEQSRTSRNLGPRKSWSFQFEPFAARATTSDKHD